jgi:tetratricopeptide (TPR) repeat protein
VWLLPFIALTGGIVIVVFIMKRWVKRSGERRPAVVDPALIERIRRETATIDPPKRTLGSGASLLDEQRTKIYGYLKDLEFDYQAGRISQEDFEDLRRQYESQAASVLRELDDAATAAPTEAETQETPVDPEVRQAPKIVRGGRNGRIVAVGAFLVIFGIAVGFFLSQSLRPRTSEQDTITGDFLTGTSTDISSHLDRGRAAFEREEWPQAIAAFKAALEIEPNHPEAHSYMGLILAQAGHADGALLAFDRALLTDPNFPLALWGRGMLLYRAKEDYAGARRTLEKLASLTPAGEERDQIQKTIVELASLEKKSPGKKPETAGSERIRGSVSLAPNLKSKIDGKAVLFIIARAGNSPAGPPLAVIRIDRPAFPVAFSLGADHVMIRGTEFAGKVALSARLDQDGNPATSEAGDLTGKYKQNPVAVGSQKIDIVLDRVN